MKKQNHSIIPKLLSLLLAISLILTSVSSLATIVYAEGGVVISSQDFEAGEATEGVTLQNGFSIVADPDLTHSNYAMYKKAGGQYNAGFDISAKAGVTYLASIEINIPELSSGYTYIWFQVGCGGTTFTTMRSKVTDGWHKLYWLITPKNDAGKLWISNADASAAYFDNFSFVELSEAETIVVDTDFSNDETAAVPTLIPDDANGSITYSTDNSGVTTATTTGSKMRIPYALKPNTAYQLKYNFTASSVFYFDYYASADATKTERHWFQTSNNNTLTLYTDANGYIDGKNTNVIFGYSATGVPSMYFNYLRLSEICDVAVGTSDYGSASVSAESIAAGESITFTASPNAGYTFDYWQDEEGNKVSSDRVYAHTVTDDTTLTPIFKNFTSYYEDFEDGSLFEGGSTSSSKYVVSATPDGSSKYCFKHETSGYDSYYINYPVLLAGHTYKMTFDMYGTVEKAAFRVDLYDSTKKIIIKELGWAQYGTAVNQWHTRTYTITPSADGSIIHFFMEKEFYLDNFSIVDVTPKTVALGKVENGTATVSAESAATGDTVTFTAKANAGYVFAGWKNGNGETVSDDVVYVHTVTDDITLTPVFEVLTYYYEDFEDGKSFTGGNGGSSYTVVASPDGSSNYCFKHTGTGYDNYFINEYSGALLAGHTYEVSFKRYSVDTSTYFRFDIYSSSREYKTTQHGISTTANTWKEITYTIKPDADGDLIGFLSTGEFYIDDFRIVDITASGNYYENFSDTDDTTLLEGTTGLDITYVYDEELGKNIANIQYPASASVDNNLVKIPFALEEDSEYRIRITYKTTGWCAPRYNHKVHGGDGMVATDSWETKDWYVTGTSTYVNSSDKETYLGDIFAIGTNVSSAALQISEITIVKVNGKGDIDNDGTVQAYDITLMRKYLIEVSTPEFFMSSADMNDDDSIDIVDLVKLKKKIAGIETVVTDSAVSLTSLDSYENVYVDTSGSETLGDDSTFRCAVSGEDANVVYKVSAGITEAAVQYDATCGNMGDFIFEVSRDFENWTKITSDSITNESINYNSWVKSTEFFSNLKEVKYFKITFPSSSQGSGIRKVQFNGLDDTSLYEINGYNPNLRAAETIYIDSSAGSDNNSGSIDAPLKTLSAAFSRTFVPGDKILLAAGGSYDGGIKLLSSGTEEAPIVISSYGEGANPIITGFEDTSAFEIMGEYVEISNLDFTCEGGFSAIDVYAFKNAAKGYKINNCNFYNINSLSDSEYYSTDCGAIHFFAKGRYPSWFDGISVEDNTFSKIQRTSVYVTSDWAAKYSNQTWGNRNFTIENRPVYLSENVVIRNNDISYNGGDAILIIGAKGALVEYNTVRDSGIISNPKVDEDGNQLNIAWASIWCHSSEDCIFQYNEVYGNSAVNSGQDLQAFDIDVSCKNCIVQYNYSHENAGGFMLLCANDSDVFGDVTNAIVRYNLSVNDGDSGKYIFDITGSVINAQIYNNTVYCGRNDVKLISFANYARAESKSTTVFTNNLFYAADGVKVSFIYGDQYTTPALEYSVFENNVFKNIDLPGYGELITHSAYFTAEPDLVNIGAVGNGREIGINYKPNSDSYLLTSGKTVADNGGKDYFGNTLPENSTLIGAFLN